MEGDVGEARGGERKRGREEEVEEEEIERESDDEEGEVPPESHEHPPWPPAPRRRLLGISGRPMKRKSEAGLQAMDIPGRLVKIGESIKFRIPPDKGGERRKGVMSAIIVNMTRAKQVAHPEFYNVRTQDALTMSAKLHPDNFWVWRGGKWYPGNHPELPEPDELEMASPPRDRGDQAQ